MEIQELRAASDEAELVRRVRMGEHAALAVVYDRHAEVVFGSLVRFLGQRELAEDLTQETFLTLWTRADRFDPRAGGLLAWLLRIARNRAIDRLRAAGRRPESRLPDTGLGRAQPTADDDPAAAATRAWTRSVVRAALASMPQAEREVIELAYDRDLSQSEIARRLGQPLGTVKTRSRRALARLRAALAHVPDLSPKRTGEPDPSPIEAPDGPR